MPTPLFRYPKKAEDGVVDGALFALASEAGTDPEILVILEAVQSEGGLRWEYALGRFSDHDLFATLDGKPVWSSVRGELNTRLHGPQHLYEIYPDKIVNPKGELLMRLKTTPEVWWGQHMPVSEKSSP